MQVTDTTLVRLHLSDLVIVHSNIKLIFKFERLSPDDPSEPEAVVGVDHFRLCRNIQDVLVFVQRAHALT